MLQGKGLWAYRRTELTRALQIAPQMGATHIIFKVGQGSEYYPGVAQAARDVREAGLVPFAWTFLLLDDPRLEAQVVVRAFHDGFQGFVFDTEADVCRNRFEQATQLGAYLRVAMLELDKIYNCSFPNISQHRDLPYDQMNEFCKGGLMPMSYGTYFGPESTVPPEQQTQRVIDEWTYGHHEYWSRRWGYRPPLYPVLGPYHDEYGRVRMNPCAIIQVDDGAVLESLEPEDVTRAKVGQEGKWLHIRTPGGTRGYVAAWYLRVHAEAVEAGVRVEVVSPEVGFLNVRPDPSTARSPITRVDDGAVLESLEPEEVARAKVGQENQWLRVRTPDGIEGYVAAWYVRFHEEGEAGEPVDHVAVHSALGLNVRRRPGTGLPPIWHVVDKTVLEVREDPTKVGDKLGKDQWLQVRTPSLREGYVNGLYVRAKRLADKRTSVDAAALSRGECAWIFGIHAAGATTPANFQFLFQGKDKAGWVLFTEAIGAEPQHTGGHDYTPWSHNGYGVIVRLNHRYEPGGTLPVRAKYADFARTCAAYVANSRGCHVWIVGNEQNNVREHPGGAKEPVEHITAQMYAEAFNLARRRIKEVQPEAIVVPGAVDPYNTYPWKLLGDRRNRPLEYFGEMLGHIDDLDGIALHTYTHWMDVGLITKPTVFQDPFLQPGTPQEHYYDFQAYRPFAEAIPEKWRDRPIYIAEANHWVAMERQPRNPQEEARVGWVNRNRGWVQAAYAEIDRWNNTPHAQQIHCLLLYRWTGDAWAIERLREIHEDFKRALDHDYRWRR